MYIYIKIVTQTLVSFYSKKKKYSWRNEITTMKYYNMYFFIWSGNEIKWIIISDQSRDICKFQNS